MRCRRITVFVLSLVLGLACLLAGCTPHKVVPDPQPAQSTVESVSESQSESVDPAALAAQQADALAGVLAECQTLAEQNDWLKDAPTAALLADAAALLRTQRDDAADAAWYAAAQAMQQQLAELVPTLRQKRPPLIEVIDGVTYADGILIVNKTYTVPETYGSGITPETQAAFDAMQAAAAGDGLSLYIYSGFRDYNYQKQLYQNYAARDGYAEADTYSARPGHSEHQTGLALDINSNDGSMAASPEGLWLAQHCAEYGFIIRYPEGKSDITGYMYEPWHIRYVGTEFAARLTASGLTMEEYFGLTSVYAEA